MFSENRDKIVDFLNRNSKKIIFSTSAVAIILAVVSGGFLWQYSRPVAVVNGEEITRSEYNRETEIVQQMATYNGSDIPASEEIRNDLVERELVKIVAKEKNITVSDSELEEFVSGEDNGYNGDVDKLYSSYNGAFGYTKEELNEEIKYTHLKEKVENVVLNKKSGRYVSVRFNLDTHAKQLTGITDSNEFDALAKSQADKFYQMLESGKTFDEVYELAKNSEKNKYPATGGFEFVDVDANSTALGRPEEEVKAIMGTSEGKYSLVTKNEAYYAIYYIDSAGTGNYDSWEEFINDYKEKYLAFSFYDTKNMISDRIAQSYNKVALNIEELTGVKIALAEPSCASEDCHGGNVSGKITVKHTSEVIGGGPLEDALVYIYAPSGGDNWCGPNEGSDNTDSDGSYSIGGPSYTGNNCLINCANGNLEWDAEVSKSGYETANISNLNISNGSVSDFNLSLVPNGSKYWFCLKGETSCRQTENTYPDADSCNESVKDYYDNKLVGSCGLYEGTCNSSCTVNVTPGALRCTLEASPVTSGKTTLSWTTENATSASIDGTSVTPVASGTKDYSSITKNKTFTMTVKNGAGDSRTCSTEVSVGPVVGYSGWWYCDTPHTWCEHDDQSGFVDEEDCESAWDGRECYADSKNAENTCNASSRCSSTNPDTPDDPTTPDDPYPACSILINGGAATTTSTDVTLSGFPTASGLDMIVWNEGDANAPGLDVPNDEYKPVPPSGTMAWNLGPTAFNFKEGNPTSRVFVKFRNSSGKKNGCVASIQYIRPACSFVVNGGDKTTKDENVTLSGFPSGVTQMVFWKEGEDLSGSEVVAGDGPATFEPFAPTKQMEVYPNIGMLTRFWARFKNSTGDISWWCSGSITLVGEDDTTDDPPPSADNKPPTIEIVSPVGEDRVFILPDGQDKMPITLTAKGVDPEGLDLSIAIMGSVNVSMPNGYSVWSGPISNPAVRSVTTEPLGPGLYGWQAGSAETLPDYDVCTKVCKTVENYLEEGKEISEKSVITTDCAEEDKIEECETVHVNNLTSDKVFGFFQIKERDIEPDLNCKIDITKGDAPLTVGAHVTGYTLGSGAYKITGIANFTFSFGNKAEKNYTALNLPKPVYYTFNEAGKYTVGLKMSGTGAGGGTSVTCGEVNVTSPTEDSGGEVSP